MKQAFAIAAVLGAISFASCKSTWHGSDTAEMEIVSSAVVLDVTGMT